MNTNPYDSTGNYAAMTLINTPFQNGGIFCNGIYGGGGNPNYCQASTPQLTNLNMNAFHISAYFKVTELLTTLNPVFACGFSYRWLVFYLAHDSTVLLKYNNNNYQSSTVKYNINQWHKAVISYKDGVVNLYLDDSLAVSINVMLIHGNDKDISITDFANGMTFRGIFKDLKIYNLDTTTTDIKLPSSTSSAIFNLSQNFPNPFNPITIIKYSVLDANSGHSFSIKLSVFDLLGREVKTLVNENQKPGNYEIEFDGSELSSGVYYYKLQAGDFVQTKKLVLTK